MIQVFHPHGVAILAAIPGVFIASDQTPLVAFMANEKLSHAYEGVPQVEILMLMSACSIGATMSSLFSGRICSYLGALDSMRVASVFWVAACVGTFCAGSNSQVVLWKLGKGVGLGLISVSSYLYMFEVLASPDRAVCVAWRVVMSVAGQACLYAVALLLRARVGSPAAFHYAWVAEAFWGVLLIGTTFFLPQSPKVLLERGKWSSAQMTHAKLTRVRRKPSTRSVKTGKSGRSQSSVKDLNGNLNGKDLSVKDSNVKDLNMKDLNAKEFNSKEFNAKDLNAKEFNSKEFNAKDFNSKEFNAKDLNAKDFNENDLNDFNHFNNFNHFNDHNLNQQINAKLSPSLLTQKSHHTTKNHSSGQSPAISRPNNPMHGWLKALFCSQLAQLLGVVVSPLFWHYLGSFCSLSTSAVDMCFHAQYVLQLVFSAFPCVFLKSASRTNTLSLGLSLMAAAYITMSVVSFVFSSRSDMAPKAYSPHHTVRSFPASSILALASFAVSVYSSLVAATLQLHGAESLSANSRYKGLSVATSTAYASAALLNGFLLYFHAVKPPIVFTVVAVLTAASAVVFMYASDTLGASMADDIPYSVPSTAHSVENLSAEAAEDSSQKPSKLVEDAGQKSQKLLNEVVQKPSAEVLDDPFARARDLAGSVPPDTCITPFQPLGHTQNFIHINKRGPFQSFKPSEARTVGTLATAKSQFTAPLVTALTRLPDDRVSLQLSRSASTSTENKENRGDFSDLWPGPY